MALAAALVRAAAPMLLRGREAPCSAPALHPRRLLSCSTTSDAPPPPARPLASKLAEPESQLPWREAQAEILRDIEPVVQLIKDILHSDRFGGDDEMMMHLFMEGRANANADDEEHLQEDENAAPKCGGSKCERRKPRQRMEDHAMLYTNYFIEESYIYPK